MSNKGKIIQVMGPVVDVAFEDENLPAIRDALEVNNGDKKCVMEVAQHIGNDTVRCIMLGKSTENLQHLKNRILQKRFLRQVSR